MVKSAAVAITILAMSGGSAFAGQEPPNANVACGGAYSLLADGPWLSWPYKENTVSARQWRSRVYQYTKTEGAAEQMGARDQLRVSDLMKQFDSATSDEERAHAVVSVAAQMEVLDVRDIGQWATRISDPSARETAILGASPFAFQSILRSRGLVELSAQLTSETAKFELVRNLGMKLGRSARDIKDIIETLPPGIKRDEYLLKLVRNRIEMGKRAEGFDSQKSIKSLAELTRSLDTRDSVLELLSENNLRRLKTGIDNENNVDALQQAFGWRELVGPETTLYLSPDGKSTVVVRRTKPGSRLAPYSDSTKDGIYRAVSTGQSYQQAGLRLLIAQEKKVFLESLRDQNFILDSAWFTNQDSRWIRSKRDGATFLRHALWGTVIKLPAEIPTASRFSDLPESFRREVLQGLQQSVEDGSRFVVPKTH